jgi:uncharacterized protein
VRGPVPAVLLLSGSGPLDRDSNMPRQRLDVSKTFAAALAERGIASLRYDKRGVGRSDGTYLATGFHQETADALTTLEALAAADPVDDGRLAVLGHSLGATIALRIAARRPDLAGIALLAVAARSGEEVMVQQSERIAATLRGPRVLGRLMLRHQERTRRRLLVSRGESLRVGWSRVPARWFREFMAYDPTADLGRIQCPVLAVTGERDLQVDADDVAIVGRLVRGPFTGSTPTLLTHVLRREEERRGLAGYPAQLRRPVDAELVQQVVTWVAARLAASA